LRELHFLVPSSTRSTMLAVLLFHNGSVESRVLDVIETPSEAVLERVHNMLGEFVPGKTLEQVRDICVRAMEHDRRVLDNLAQLAYELGLLAAEPTTDHEPVIVIEGRARLFANPDFGDVELLRDLAATLEEREALLMLLDRTLLGQTVQVLVGEQTGNLGKGSLGLVVAPFTDGHERLGTVGVLGPTRMNYPKLVPLVSATASAISTAHERAAGLGGEPDDDG
jgi:heat-inducible transcriptional repressor